MAFESSGVPDSRSVYSFAANNRTMSVDSGGLQAMNFSRVSMNASGEFSMMDMSMLMGLTDDEKRLVVVGYSLIMLLSFVGNTLVIIAVLGFRHMRRIHINYLILNLALGDLLSGTVCTFFTYMPMFVHFPGAYPYGDVVCKATGFAQMASVFASSYTLVIISIDRYFAIVFPLQTRLMLTRRGAQRAVVGVWMASAIICSPMLFALRVRSFKEDRSDAVCTEDWGETDYAHALNLLFSVGFVVLQYFVPLGVLLLTYGAICCDLWRPPKSAVANGTNATTTEYGTNPMVDDRREIVKKMLPMVILMSVVYAGCWFPLNMFSNVLYPLRLVPVESVADVNRFLRLFWACHTLAMAHCFCNPLLLSLQSKRYRHAFRRTLLALLFWRKRRFYDQDDWRGISRQQLDTGGNHFECVSSLKRLATAGGSRFELMSRKRKATNGMNVDYLINQQRLATDENNVVCTPETVC